MTVHQNILETLCRHISIKTENRHLTQSHKIPVILISKCLFDYLNSLNDAEQFKKKVPKNVVDAWIEQETKKALDSLQNTALDTVKYALLSERDITSDEVMALLEKAYNESAGES